MGTGRDAVALSRVAASARVRALALEAGFDLCGFARPDPIPGAALLAWLAAGMAADMDWMGERAADRLDPRRLLPGARTVAALACNYWTEGGEAEASPIARYARGRDYHATLRDRLRTLRRLLRAEHPGVGTYGSVDHGPFMEKVWAARAGLGVVARNGCLVTPRYGSWVVLALLVLDLEVDAYADGPAADRCGTCRLCVDACPTGALDGAGGVDARACLSYQTIENEGPVPVEHREAMAPHVFGCDVCQDVCPLNAAPLAAHGQRFQPRPVAGLDARGLAAMTAEAYAGLVPGTALARAGYDGLRRNAAYALGAARDAGARPVLETLARDPSAVVSDAARWALARLPPP
ncbi:MAG TPA: tRNA epoxyqueuosine(34) reductase QueG [Myxococcaceae bacterium]|nr:tRNA epoxyqueuosine(34) reductase QueG [Myxococcaceae bacterium]